MIGFPSGTDHSRRSLLIAVGLVLVATIAIYSPAVEVGFLGDDFMILHRLRGLHGASDALHFFRGEFFDYYRPLGFVSHAVDWAMAGQNAREFHRTNVLLHVVNTILVLLIGRSLSPRPLVGGLAAALFALHASNNEAVVWISARFDLLAACFGLAAMCYMMRGGTLNRLTAPLLFFGALLSKEAAVALPIAAAGWSTFRQRATTFGAAAFITPWLVALAAYSVLRHIAGGVSPVGGASRIPKLAAFIIVNGLILAVSSSRWMHVRDWLKPRRTAFAVLAIPIVIVLLIAAQSAPDRLRTLAREKLAVAGFATFYLASPVLAPGESIFSDPASRSAGIVGAAAMLTVVLLLVVLWHRLLDDDRYWFLGALLVATVLPISALTEGKRYLYLPSAAMSLIVAILVVESLGRWRRVALTILAGMLAISVVQIVIRLQDWRWAGRMTAEGAQRVDAALAPTCGTGHVVFLTSPVAMRGVYSHFYYETFEVPRGCMPAVFQVLVRVVRIDTAIDVTWDGPGQLLITAAGYRENFVLSTDLRAFDAPLRFGAPLHLQTPLGSVMADASDGMARVRLTLSPEAQREAIYFFYYSAGRIQPLAAPITGPR